MSANSSELAHLLEDIVGQETDPPLWVWVGKDQLPALRQAADLLRLQDKMKGDSWISGFIAASRLLTGQYRAFAKDRDAFLRTAR